MAMPTSVPGQELDDLAPRHLLAVAADQRGAGGDADQRPGRHQHFQRHHEAEQRHRGGGAEARRAARRIGDHHHHAAIDDREGGEGFDGGHSASAAHSVIDAEQAVVWQPLIALRHRRGTLIAVALCKASAAL